MSMIASDFIKGHKDTGYDGKNSENEERDGKSDFFDRRTMRDSIGEGVVIVH